MLTMLKTFTSPTLTLCSFACKAHQDCDGFRWYILRKWSYFGKKADSALNKNKKTKKQEQCLSLDFITYKKAEMLQFRLHVVSLCATQVHLWTARGKWPLHFGRETASGDLQPPNFPSGRLSNLLWSCVFRQQLVSAWSPFQIANGQKQCLLFPVLLPSRLMVITTQQRISAPPKRVGYQKSGDQMTWTR